MKSLSHIACAGLLACFTFTATAADDSTYAGLGGKQGVHQIVTTLVELVLADKRIKEPFSDSDMQHVAMRLEEQFCAVSGGPCQYKGKDMVLIHEGMDVTNAQFNAMAEDLQVAMERNGVPSRIQFKLLSKLAPMQHDIVTK